MQIFLHEMLNREETRAGRITAIVIGTLIVANVVTAIIETIPSLPPAVVASLNLFELFSIVIFSSEYVLRVIACTGDQAYGHPVWGRLRFVFTPMALVDLAVLLPFYCSTGIDGRTLRVIRLLRLMRLLRYDPYAKSLRGFAVVISQRRGDLMLCGMLSLGVLLVSATVMYYAERDAQPDKMGSIPDCIWWAVIHLTTIGYGDVYPITLPGKIVAGISALFGVGLVTLPSTIFGMAYVEHITRERAALKDQGKPPGGPA